MDCRFENFLNASRNSYQQEKIYLNISFVSTLIVVLIYWACLGAEN